jgi:hypothetical protein
MTTSNSELLERVRNGNAKITEVYQWALLIDLSKDREKWDKEMDRVDKAATRLTWLCMELEAKGFHGCIQAEPICAPPGNGFCWVCPSETPYWRGQEVLF